MFDLNAGFGAIRGAILSALAGAIRGPNAGGGARRKLAMLGTLALLGGCQSMPSGQHGPASPIAALPTDGGRHRVALLVPLTGPNAGAGQSLANATTMALLD